MQRWREVHVFKDLSHNVINLNIRSRNIIWQDWKCTSFVVFIRYHQNIRSPSVQLTETTCMLLRMTSKRNKNSTSKSIFSPLLLNKSYFSTITFLIRLKSMQGIDFNSNAIKYIELKL